MSSKSISSGKTKAGQHVESHDAIDFPSTGSPHSSGHRPSLLKTTIKRASVKSLRRSISSTFHLHHSSSADDEAADASDDESSVRSSLEPPPSPDHHHHHHLLHLPFHRHHSHSSGRRSLSGVGSGGDYTGSAAPEADDPDTPAKPAVHSFVVLGRRNRTQSEDADSVAQQPQPSLEFPSSSSPPAVKTDSETGSIGSSVSQSQSSESAPVTVEIQEQEPPSQKSEFESFADIPTIVEPVSSPSFLTDQGAYHEDEPVVDSVTVEVLEVQEQEGQAQSQKLESEPVSSSSIRDKSDVQGVYQGDDHPAIESGSATMGAQEVPEQEQEREPQSQKLESEFSAVSSPSVHDESDVQGDYHGDEHGSVTVEVQEVQDQEIQPQSQPEFESTTELPPVSSSSLHEESGAEGVYHGDDHAADRSGTVETQEPQQEIESQSQKPEEAPMTVEPASSPSLLHDENRIPGTYHEDELILIPVRGNDSPISASGSIGSESLLSSDWTSIDASTPGTSIHDDSPQHMDFKESSELEHRHSHLGHLSNSPSSRTPTPSLPKYRAPSRSTTPVLSPSTLPISPTPPRHYRNAQSPLVHPEEDDIITPYVLNELVIPALGGSPRTRPRSWTYPPKSNDLRRRDVDTSTSDLDSDSYTPRSNSGTLVDSTFIRELVWLIWVSVRRRISLYLTWWLPSPVQRMCLGLRRYLEPLYEPNSSDYSL